MALSLYAASIVAKNGNATSVSLTIPVGAFGGADGACVIVSIAVAPVPFITAPSGWTLVRTVSSTTVIQLATYVRNATAVDEGVTFTWTWTGTKQYSAGMEAWAGGGIAAQTGQSTPSALTHTALALTANLAGSVMRCAFAIAMNGTWTPDVAQTEDVDTTSASTTSIETAHDFLAGIGTSGTRTATATGPAAVGCTQSIILAPSGATQPTGTGGTIYLYDDTLSANAVSYGPAELVTLYPADVLSLATQTPSYEAKVTIQMGDQGIGSAATTLAIKKDSFRFDNGKTLLYRSTQTGSWNTNFGTKVGTGVEASGTDGPYIGLGSVTTFRGNLRIYDTKIEVTSIANGTLVFQEKLSGVTIQELMGSTIGTQGSGTISFTRVGGTAGEQFDTVYNCRFWSRGLGVGTAAVSSFSVANSSRNEITGAVSQNVMSASSGADSVMKDLVLKGSPTGSDLRTQNTALRFKMVRIVWTGNAAKLSGLAPATLADAHQEMRWWQIKVMNTAGAPISGIPVDLTDAVGTTILSQALTDANGAVLFGSGNLAQAVTVRDHYLPGGVYTTRDRSPFTATINGGAAQNFAYTKQVILFNWPGIETGVFSDVFMQVNLLAPVLRADFSVNPGGGTSPLTVQFTDRSTPSLGNTITAWAWTFGDAGTSTAQNPSHVYAAAGLYTVALTVTDASGSVTETDVAAVYVRPPTGTPRAAFTLTPVSGAVPLSVQFTDDSQPGNAAIVSWVWTFGDGGTSTAQSPLHVYTIPGTYTVTLVVTDSLGQTDDFTIQKAVSAFLTKPSEEWRGAIS